MEYKDIEHKRNTYSTDYKMTGGKIRLTGKFPQNFVEFDVVDVSGINTDDIEIYPDLKLDFLVEMTDGETTTLYTSSEFLQTLKKAKDGVDPFFNKNTVTTIKINFDELTNRHKLYAGDEKYAQVEVTKTMTTKEDFLKHINWLVNESDKNLRPTSDFGAYTVNDPIDETMIGNHGDSPLDKIRSDETSKVIETPPPPRPEHTRNPSNIFGRVRDHVRHHGLIYRIFHRH